MSLDFLDRLDAAEAPAPAPLPDQDVLAIEALHAKAEQTIADIYETQETVAAIDNAYAAEHLSDNQRTFFDDRIEAVKQYYSQVCYHLDRAYGTELASSRLFYSETDRGTSPGLYTKTSSPEYKAWEEWEPTLLPPDEVAARIAEHVGPRGIDRAGVETLHANFRRAAGSVTLGRTYIDLPNYVYYDQFSIKWDQGYQLTDSGTDTPIGVLADALWHFAYPDETTAPSYFLSKLRDYRAQVSFDMYDFKDQPLPKDYTVEGLTFYKNQKVRIHFKDAEGVRNFVSHFNLT